MKFSASLQIQEQIVILLKLINGSITIGWLIFLVWLLAKTVEMFV